MRYLLTTTYCFFLWPVTHHVDPNKNYEHVKAAWPYEDAVSQGHIGYLLAEPLEVDLPGAEIADCIATSKTADIVFPIRERVAQMNRSAWQILALQMCGKTFVSIDASG